MKKIKNLLISIVSFGCLVWLSGCAQYQIQSNKELGYSKKIERLYVWSAMNQIPQLRDKHWTQSNSFNKLFHDDLTRELITYGIDLEIQEFVPATDSLHSLARFENTFAPSTRLLITPAKHQTMSYQGTTAVTQVALDLSLFDVANNRRVWRAQLLIDNPLAGRLTWGEDGARNLTSKIVEALKSDQLIPNVARAEIETKKSE